jgi:hypothetical protein
MKKSKTMPHPELTLPKKERLQGVSVSVLLA